MHVYNYIDIDNIFSIYYKDLGSWLPRVLHVGLGLPLYK
jgi:hypothetical protein